MAELADALDLGSSGRPCRFKSCHPHYYRVFRRLDTSKDPVFLRFDINVDINGNNTGEYSFFLLAAGCYIMILRKLEIGIP